MEETELSSVFMNDLDEEFKEEESVEKQNNRKSVFSKRRRNTEYYDAVCVCMDRNLWGKKCECVTIKEDIRILFSLGDFIDKLILRQKEALQVPLEKAKPYNMLDMVLDMNFKFGDCNCEQDEESNISENGQSSEQKELPASCLCPDLPKKRCVLRIIRNDIFQRMNLVKKLNFLLLEKNKKIKEMVKKRKKNDPSSPYITRSVSFDESIHRLVERYKLLKEMKEVNLPKACLFDKKELLEHIGQHRVLTKPLRHIYLIEELATKVREKTKSSNDFEECSPSDKSSSVEKDECRCPEIDKKIEFIKNFKAMISRLNPIGHGKEEILDVNKADDKTVEQLVKEIQKEERQRLADLVQSRNIAVQVMKAQSTYLEEAKMLTDAIQMLNAYIVQLDAQLESEILPNSKAEETVAKLTDEKKELLKLTVLLNEYKNRFDVPPEDEKLLLEEINRKLKDYLDKQKKYFDAMEKLIPGFKIAIFDNELEKDRIVAEICRDDGEKSSIPKEDEQFEQDGRERFRTLIKGLNKPHLHVVGNPLGGRNETSRTSIRNKNIVSQISTNINEKNQASVENNIFIKKKLITKLKKVEKSIDSKLSGEKHECDYEILEEEILKEFSDPVDPPLPKRVDSNPSNLNYAERVKIKLKSLAFDEGRKIVSKPDPFIPKQENLVRRKRLIHDLGLKCKRGGKCCTEKLGPSKLMLKVAYETEQIKDCRCTNRQKQLRSLENDFEDIILQPQKHHIDYVEGSLKFTNPRAVKKV